ncbi:MAG TPA: Maf family nucleotide pyrophosphatase [bacterium]|nr:Maf family nucleotide pyrophosphatase [bacterium]
MFTCREKIVLASASPRRRELLASAGIAVQAVASGVSEEGHPGEGAEARVRRLAEAKARAVARAAGAAGRFFIGADTMVVRGEEALGKPRDRGDAERMLRALSGGAHEVVTGVAVYDAAADRMHVEAVRTRVTFKALRDREIAAYVAEDRPFDKAGAYGIQGRAAFMVERIDGSYTNVVGLPLCETVEALLAMGAISARAAER